MATTKATLLGHRSATSFSDLTLSGDLTVNGTTTTLDTTVQNVDKLEIGASSTDYGAKINQASTGNILQLQDGGTDVLVVKDGGNVDFSNASDAIVTIKSDEANSAGNTDVQLRFRLDGADKYTVGVDDDDSDKFKIFTGGGFSGTGMKMDSSGNMDFNSTGSATFDIGPNRPDALTMTVNSTSDTKLQLQETETTKVQINASGDSYFNGGKVGIGESGPNEKLHVKDDIGGTVSSLQHVMKIELTSSGTPQNGIGPSIMFNSPMTGQNDVELGYIGYQNDNVSGAYGNFVVYTRPNAPSALRLTVANNGNIGAPSGTNIYNASDARLKQNVTNLSGSLEKIKQMQGVSFNWVDGFCDPEADKTLYGLIAQDLQSVDSNLVDSFSDNSIIVNDVTVENPLRVNEKFIIPVLVEAVKELSAKVTALENA